MPQHSPESVDPISNISEEPSTTSGCTPGGIQGNTWQLTPHCITHPL